MMRASCAVHRSASTFRAVSLYASMSLEIGSVGPFRARKLPTGNEGAKTVAGPERLKKESSFLKATKRSANKDVRLVDHKDPQREVELKAKKFREESKVSAEGARRIESLERISTTLDQVESHITGITKEKEDLHTAYGDLSSLTNGSNQNKYLERQS